MKIEQSQYEQVVQNALSEDRCRDDITTGVLIPPESKGIARIIAKENGTLAGTNIAAYIFHEIDSGLDVQVSIYDGSLIKPGDVLITIAGATASILKAERTVLNFMQHLSGIATETARYVELIKDLPCQVTDTRKTIPGMRVLEKYAVAIGGGKNHRMHLNDGILIKDNHLDIL